MKETDLQVKILYDENELQFSKVFLQHPLSVCLKVTNKCNFNCSHCLSCPDPDREDRELTTWELMSVMDIIRRAGVPRLNISGGEPFIRCDPLTHQEDIGDLLTHAKSVGFEVSVTTNGSKVRDEHIKMMKSLRIVPDISLDAPTPELNDKLRKDGSYDKIMELIKRLKLAEVPFILNCTIQQENFSSFDEFVEFGQKQGCRKIYAIILRPQGKARKIHNIELDDRQIHVLSDKIEGYKSKYRGKMSIGLMDLRKYPRSFVLIEPDSQVISQSHKEEDNLKVGHLLINRDLNWIWQQPNSFDHTSHLLHYIKG